ncbi:hypothetical protein [Pedobacter foliorum]|uniref:hypothetical protein n=1 Tax=Pedobacter foliorum TaxID=2739058 RepID=UPI0015642A43|nr:hypothetical protein [Pedobacter foliorum]NRF41122.1 hypothetical protein [Pedobacter foliorum]
MKRLFFATLLATVAIGGALTTNATTFYGPNPNNTPYSCNGAVTLCSTAIPQQFVWTQPGESGTKIRVTNLPVSEKFN